MTQLADGAAGGVTSEVLQESRQPQSITTQTLAVVDRAFHEGLARAAGNEAILSALVDINDRLMVFQETEAEVSGRTEEMLLQHRATIDAIAAGETGAAAKHFAGTFSARSTISSICSGQCACERARIC